MKCYSLRNAFLLLLLHMQRLKLLYKCCRGTVQTTVSHVCSHRKLQPAQSCSVIIERCLEQLRFYMSPERIVRFRSSGGLSVSSHLGVMIDNHAIASTGTDTQQTAKLTKDRTDWIGIVEKDLQRLGLAFIEAEAATLDGQEWHWSVAQWTCSEAW